MVAWAPPYSVIQSVSAPDRQMVVVPATSTNATTATAKVSFTVLPFGRRRYGHERFGWAGVAHFAAGPAGTRNA